MSSCTMQMAPQPMQAPLRLSSLSTQQRASTSPRSRQLSPRQQAPTGPAPMSRWTTTSSMSAPLPMARPSRSSTAQRSAWSTPTPSTLPTTARPIPSAPRLPSLAQRSSTRLMAERRGRRMHRAVPTWAPRATSASAPPRSATGLSRRMACTSAWPRRLSR